jgi:tRNA U34 2-thiouridine synthase MnmA/TrmU
LAAKDRTKDQSYFLCGVPAKVLANVVFPLGDYYKKRDQPSDIKTSNGEMTVRELAMHANLPNASKRESMGICFVGKRKHGEFLNEYIPSPFSVTKLQCINIEDGKVMATVDPHPSLMYATTGQGAKISGASQKWFVVEKRDSRLILCPGTHHPALYSDTLFIDASQMHWMMGGIPPPLPFHAKCRIRHLQPLVNCKIDFVDQNGYQVQLETPLRGIAQGQVCAIYAGGNDGGLICLGGGPIQRRGPSYWDLQQDLPQLLHPAGHNDLSTTKM